MAKSLLRWKEVIIQVVKDRGFEQSAGTSRSERRTGDDEQVDMLELLLEEGMEADLQPLDMPERVAANKKFANSWKAVCSDTFWAQLAQYVKLNECVAAAITALGGTSATLSDAALRMLQLNTHFVELSASDYAELLPTADIAILRALWHERYANHLRPHHHLALLLDPRKHFRQFVRGRKDLIGSSEEENVGNTPYLRSADSVLEEISKFAFQDSEKCVSSIAKKQQAGNADDLSFEQSVHKKLTGELKAWLGIHPNAQVTLPPGVQASKLNMCTSDCDPFDFWSTEVMADKSCLRKAAMRVLSAKPSSCAVERVWSHFRDVFSPKRRSMLSTTLRRLVFVKLNMHLIPHDSLTQADMNECNTFDRGWVQSIVDATEQHDHELEVQKAAKEGEDAVVVPFESGAGVSEPQDVVELDSEEEEDALMDH